MDPLQLEDYFLKFIVIKAFKKYNNFNYIVGLMFKFSSI